MKLTRRFGVAPSVGCVMAALVLVVAGSLALGGSALGAEKSIGIHFGPSIPSLQGGGGNPLSEGYSSRFAPYFGVFADYGLSRNLGIRAEINYASQGGQRNGLQPALDPALSQAFGTMVYANFNNEAVLDYIEIPVLAKYSWGGGMRFFVDGGPYVGYLVRARTITSGVSALFDASGNPLPVPPTMPANLDFGANTDVMKDINRWNFGLGAGLGAETLFGPGNIVFDVHFSYGLTNIQRDTALNGSNNTGAMTFTLGYSVPWK